MDKESWTPGLLSYDEARTTNAKRRRAYLKQLEADIAALARWALAIHQASTFEGVETVVLDQAEDDALAIPTERLAKLAGEVSE